jgi:hypothetical protein
MIRTHCVAYFFFPLVHDYSNASEGVFDMTQLHGSPKPQCSVVELQPTLNLERKVLKID